MAELSAEAKAEIAAAARILKSDGFHIHKTYPAFKAAQEKAEADAKNNPPAPAEGQPPPVKETPEPEYEEVIGLWGTKRVPKKKADGPPPAA